MSEAVKWVCSSSLSMISSGCSPLTHTGVGGISPGFLRGEAMKQCEWEIPRDAKLTAYQKNPGKIYGREKRSSWLQTVFITIVVGTSLQSINRLQNKYCCLLSLIWINFWLKSHSTVVLENLTLGCIPFSPWCATVLGSYNVSPFWRGSVHMVQVTTEAAAV